MTSRQWVINFIIGSLFIIVLVFGAVYTVDPYIHYKLPDERFSYVYNRETERYVNDGITRLYDYDSIITGTSMTECFRTSEFDSLFSANSIKVPFAGAKYDEITNNLKASFLTDHNVRYVVRSMDYYALIDEPIHDRSDDNSYPLYLYDNNVLNDYRYVFDKKAFVYSAVDIIKSLFLGEKGVTSFDDYSNWSDTCLYGINALHSRDSLFWDNKDLIRKPDDELVLSEGDKDLIRRNITENYINLALEYPRTQFFVFLPPFSVVKWGELYETGSIKRTVSAEKLAVAMLIEVPNIHVYAYDNLQWITTDLDNYREKEHYGGWINSYILETMSDGNNEITIENIDSYFDCVYQLYMDYNYEILLK